MFPKKMFEIFMVFIFLIAGCSSDENNGEPNAKDELGEFLDDFTYRVYPKPPNSNFDVGEFRLWVPENPTDLKAILVLLTHYNGNSLEIVGSEEWQTYAEKERLGLVGVNLKSRTGTYFYDDATAGSGQALEDAIKAIATKNGFDEIASLPFLLRGYSGGGVFSYYFSIHNPERTAGFVNIRGGSILHDPANHDMVTGLMLVGGLEENERIELLKGIVLNKRKSGGPWSFAIESNADHYYDLEASDKLAKVYFSALLKKRISSNSALLSTLAEGSGWLGNAARTEIYPYADYPEDKTDAFWLVDEEFANAWLEYQK